MAAPGGAQIGPVRTRMQELEKDFVVVNWDQRAAGLSYSAKVPPESMTLAQFLADAEIVAEWVLQEFEQQKLFLVGHSWGTVLGTLLVASRYDYNTPSALAAAYLDQLAAPRKELIWFEDSAHGLMLEEPQEFVRVMRRILAEQPA